MLEFNIDLTIADQPFDLVLGQHEGAIFHMFTWSFTSIPTAGSCEILVDRGDGSFTAISQTSSDRALTPGHQILYAGPLDSFRVLLTGVTGGAGAVLRLWSFDQSPTLGVPDGVYTGNRAETQQTYTEANVKKGLQFETSTYNSAFPALGTSGYIITTGSKDVVLKGRVISVSGLGLKLELFKNPTYTGGVTLPIFNLNHRNAEATTVSIKGAPTVTVDGTKVSCDRYILGSQPQGGGAVSSSTLFNDAQGLETILPANSVFYFKSTSLDDATQVVASYNTWYEGPTDLP